MKRIMILCLLFALLLACQPTPEEEFVKNKSDGTLEELIHEQTSPSATTPAETGEVNPLYAQLGAPERFTMEPETRTVPFSNLTISADAVVVLPNVSAIPVYEASGKTIPENGLKRSQRRCSVTPNAMQARTARCAGSWRTGSGRTRNGSKRSNQIRRSTGKAKKSSGGKICSTLRSSLPTRRRIINANRGAVLFRTE